MANSLSIPRNVPCVAGTLRRASRALTSLYDSHLSQAGLTTAQFSLLRTLEGRGGRASLAELTDALVFERTSLYRALTPLRRAGLVSVRASADRRAREVVLTPRANRRIAAAVPHWIAAQRAVLDSFGEADWPAFAARLADLTAAARSVRPA